MPAETNVSSPPTPQVSSYEWRWVLIVSAVLLIIVSLPFVWAFWVTATTPDAMFMGLVSNPLDGATYLSKIQLGREGHWQTQFRHSPGADQGAYLTLVYNGLGQVSRYLGLNNTVMYHMGRIVGGIFMLFALYQLGASVWQRVATRRLFFVTVVFGAGFGWLVSAFGWETPDLFIPEAFPLYSVATNVHFPVALAILALMVSVVVRVFRPGFRGDPTIANGGLTLLLGALALALVAPHALIPFTLGLGLLIVIDWVRRRQVLFWQFRWMMMIVLPVLPMVGYYAAELRYNPVVALWNAQNINLSPSLPVYLLGFGLPLLVAVPGIYRAIRHYEADGDRFMLLWLVSMLIMVYFPTSAQRRFSMGFMLPVAYFAVRGLQDFWFASRPEPWRKRTTWAFLIASSLSYVFLMILWFYAASSVNDPRLYLDSDYGAAFRWVDRQTRPGEVTLSGEDVGVWLPGKAGVSVVYGHPYETINAAQNQAAVTAWYETDDPDDPICQRLIDRYDVSMVIAGPLERTAAGEPSACLETLTEVRQFGDVTLYAP